MQRTTVYVNNVRLGAIIDGPAQSPDQGTLVLLHGFTGSAATWEPLFPQLAPPGWRLIALDMLGHGQSAAPADPQRYAIEHCQADIIAVLQTCGVKQGQAVLLGYSMGGRIALYSAFSGFFRALILESASPGLLSAAEREARRHSDNALADSIERDGLAAFVSYWEQLPLFATQRTLPLARREALHAQRLQNRPDGLANSLRGVGTGNQPSLHGQLPALTLPSLLIAGSLDPKYAAIARQMAASLPLATLSIVAGAGHTIHLEQPETFASLVRTFLLTLTWKGGKGTSVPLPEREKTWQDP